MSHTPLAPPSVLLGGFSISHGTVGISYTICSVNDGAEQGRESEEGNMTGEESGSPPAGSRNPGRRSDGERVDTAGLSGWPVGRGRSLCLCPRVSALLAQSPHQTVRKVLIRGLQYKEA